MGDGSPEPISADHPLQDLSTSFLEALPAAPAPADAPQRRALVPAVTRLVMAAAWHSRRSLRLDASSDRREPFALPLKRTADRLYYRAADGWESPLWRYPAAPGAAGEPVVLAHGLGLGAAGFDLPAASLAGALRGAGYTVYLLSHRGDPLSVAPPGAGPFDFDDIAGRDVPAALARVRATHGGARALWVGHAMGGQLLYAHLALAGAEALAGVIALCAPVRFAAPRSHARLAAAIASLLPAGWAVPARGLHRALAPLAGEGLWQGLGGDLDGPGARGLMLEGAQDLPAGLLRQLARWIAAGTLCDRGDRLDYVAALAGQPLPLLVVAAAGDPTCPPAAAYPAFEALSPDTRAWLELGEGWGHLDALVGRRAAAELYPALLAWLERWRARCWE